MNREEYKERLINMPLGNPAMGKTHTGLLVVDHDHETGKVRGLLCHNCNRAIGLLQDSTQNLQNAISYLEGATTSRKA